ncbi:MAG: NADAR family protein [Alphaproteobacteria bacterium]|nr:MAG: NADAR family protein [Alphaproteobacteria bacterium]
MKFLRSIFFLLNLFIAQSGAEEVIPHYKVYPRTPITDYQNSILDFYSVKNSFGEFSNFALFPIVVEGLLWPSSEHYYQAQKFIDPLLKELVRNAATPFLAAQIGRDPNLPMRDDWDDIKDGVMLVVLRAKFSQYNVLKELLLSTNQSHIYEHTKNDCYWADCGDRTGLNKLGEQLMLIRKEISNEILLNDE